MMSAQRFSGDQTKWASFCIALVLLALAVRMLPVLSLGLGDLIVTDDPPYHALRVMRLLSGSAGPRDLDPFVAHPYGAVVCWPWGFDYLLATIARPMAGSPPERQAVVAAISITIPLFGALAIPLLFWFGRACAHQSAVLIAAGLLCFLPAHYDYSFFGRADHHVLEPLVPLLALAGPARVWARWKGRLPTLGSGLAAGASFAFIPAALPIAVTSLVVGGGLLLITRPHLAIGYGLAGLAGTILSLIVSPHPLSFVFYSPSLLQVTLVGWIAVGLAAGSLAGYVGVLSWQARMGWGLAGAAVTCALTLGVIEALREALFAGTQYLRGSDFARLSLESEPLWSDLARAGMLTTWLAPLALVGVAHFVFGASQPGAGDAANRRAVGVLAVGLIAPAILQRRFLVAASPLLALAIGEALWWIWRSFDRLRARQKRTARFALLVVALAGIAPSVWHVATLEPLSAMDRAMVRAARTLSKVPRESLGPQGVLAPWSYGHVFQFEAGLPTVCDNFFGPPENDEALSRCLETFYETDESKAASRLRDLSVAFVVLEPPHPEQVRTEAPLIRLDPSKFVNDEGVFLPGFAATLWGRLGLFAQSARPGDPGPAGTRFLGRLLEVRPDTATIEAEVLLFAVDPQETL